MDDLTDDIIKTGEIGDDIYYVLHSNGRLLLCGTYATYDYDLRESPFWENENIKSLVVSEGITTIGNSVFERCSNMATVSFPNMLESIRKRAFFMYTTDENFKSPCIGHKNWRKGVYKYFCNLSCNA